MEDPARELLILGVLRRAPMSAYALDRVVRAHTTLYRALKHGNVYHAVARLESAGLLLTKHAKTLRGPARNKRLFRLSALGERRFRALLSQLLKDIQAPQHAVEIAYVLLGQLPRTAATQLLSARLKEVNDHERRLGRLFGGTDERSGTGYLAYLHTLAHVRSEQRFLRDALALLNDKKWSPQWVSDDGPVVNPKRRA